MFIGGGLMPISESAYKFTVPFWHFCRDFRTISKAAFFIHENPSHRRLALGKTPGTIFET
jgi:hypothetical protein